MSDWFRTAWWVQNSWRTLWWVPKLMRKLNTDRLCSEIGGWNLLQPSNLKIVGRRYWGEWSTTTAMRMNRGYRSMIRTWRNQSGRVDWWRYFVKIFVRGCNTTCDNTLLIVAGNMHIQEDTQRGDNLRYSDLHGHSRKHSSWKDPMKIEYCKIRSASCECTNARAILIHL